MNRPGDLPVGPDRAAPPPLPGPPQTGTTAPPRRPPVFRFGLEVRIFVLGKVPVAGSGLRRAARGGGRLILRIQAFTRQQEIEPVGGIDIPAWGRYRNRRTVGGKPAGQGHRDVGSRTEVGGAALVLDRFDNERHVIRISIQLMSPIASHPRPGSV